MKKLFISILFLLLFAGSGFTADTTHVFINAVKFDTAGEIYTSSSFDYVGQSSYKNFLLMTDVNATGDTATMTLTIKLQWSDDDTTFYDYKDVSPYSSGLSYTTVDAVEIYNIRDTIPRMNYLRVKATSAGCDTSDNYYTTSVKGKFSK